MKTSERVSVFKSGVSYTMVPTRGRASFLTVCVERFKGESSKHMLMRLEDIMIKQNAYPLIQWVFGGINPVSRIKDISVEQYIRFTPSPVIWLNGDGNPNAKVTCAQAFAIIRPRLSVSRLTSKQATPAVFYSDAYGEYGYIGGTIGLECEKSTPPEAQTEAALEAIRTLCRFDGAKVTDIARTWFYLDRLLVWYDAFNVARTDFFKKTEIFKHIVPSSTGIGAINADGAAVSLSAFIVKSPSGEVKSEAVPSPMQCPALDYKSSFSRAHLITHPDYKMLLVSGTASILPGGESAYETDCYKQVELSMQVVKAIMDEQKFNWLDVTRAICYFKNIDDVPHYLTYLEKNNIPDFPTLYVQTDVCRDELLFEIELDAIQV